MKETRFKTLMHCGMYVDANLLEKGIYSCSKPYLYNMNETIETMIAKAEQVRDMMGKHHISDKYFENLKECQMVQLCVVEAYVPENNMEKMIMEYPSIGTKIIAKTDCKMEDGSGNALIIGKEYEVIYHSTNTEEIAIKSELFPYHFFSIHSEYDSYWKRYFDAVQ